MVQFERNFGQTTGKLFNPGHYYAKDAEKITQTSSSSVTEIQRHIVQMEKDQDVFKKWLS